MAVMCTAQAMPPHGGEGDAHSGMLSPGAGAAIRSEFGQSCGIQDTSTESAIEVVRSSEGEWSAVPAGGGAGTIGGMTARVWRETHWMVDIHGSLGPGMATMHTGQMCFDPQGRITHMIDRYVEMTACGCMRFTSVTFATNGRVVRRAQRYIKVATGAEIAAPEVATGFPDVWDFRTLEQLPFYSLLKK
jgi:hypothetical protein